MTELTISELDVDRLIQRFDGDPRAVIKALMHDLELAIEMRNEGASRGFLRREHRLSVGWGGGVEGEPSCS